MEKNIVTNLVDICLPLVLDSFNGNLAILYYSHIPAIVVSLLFGFFVLLKGKEKLLSRIFFSLSTLLALWAVLDLFTWLSWNTAVQMFTWSITTIVEPLLFVASFYLMYVFTKKEDMPFFYKLVIFLVLLPLIAIIPTTLNLYAFNATECYSLENSFGLNYKYFIEIISTLSIFIFSIINIKKSEEKLRPQIIVLAIGILLFLFSFFSAVFLGGYLAEKGWEMAGYGFEIYGLFGAILFMGSLVYLVVKFKTFEIKLLGAQALVVVLVILVGSQFTFTENVTSMVLTGITLALSLGFGYMLIRSVKKESERKEQLQQMADKLAVANDELRKLDNAKTEFISIASHQLRTPMTAIKGFISLILEGTYGEISPQVRSALDKVYVSGEHLIHLVEDLLNVSRIESGRMQYTMEKTDMKEIMDELYANFCLVAKTKNLYLDMKLPREKMPEIIMDKGKIREVVSNLIDNALKYSEKGGVTVTIEVLKKGTEIPPKSSETASTEKGAPIDGDALRLTVSDTGVGIPAEEMSYLFKKFSRGKDVARLHVGGTGLGIYVAKNIMEAHKGRIWVESEGAGKGSRFIMELPINT